MTHARQRIPTSKLDGTLFQPVSGRRPPAARWLVVWLEAFRLERCGYAADELVALIAERRSATRLVALTPAARARGLREEMTAAEARALVSEVVLEPWDEAGEDHDRESLIQALRQRCDRIQALPLGTARQAEGALALALEISVHRRAHGSEAELAAQIQGWLAGLGHHVQLAVADHPWAALALAEACPPGAPARVVPPGEGAIALADLPFRVLRPSEALAKAARALGIRTVGAWAQLDPGSVTGRFGAEGDRLLRVARGEAEPAWTRRTDEPLPDLVRVEPDEPPCTVDALQAELARGLTQLTAQLGARDRVLATLEIQLELEDGYERLVAHLLRPTGQTAPVLRLLRGRLERLTLTSPVQALTLRATDVVVARGEVIHLFDRRDAAEPLPDLVQRLADVLGVGRAPGEVPLVFQPVLTDAWRPERAWGVHHAPRLAVDDPVEAQEGAAWDAPRPRPTRLRSPPWPIRVLTTDTGRPARWRHARWEEAFTHIEGPERLSGEWWEADGGFDRVYWAVACEAGIAWIFEERGQWFLHGWFD